ncbi:hypothetical protein [Qipengyuania sp. RANM35]|uniref:hypothetical protein n=1 Tax=Qipengyuania sp. RANM35 TaxID=3068635 RepID=UPI0034DAFD95
MSDSDDKGRHLGPKDAVGCLAGGFAAYIALLFIAFGVYGGSPCHGDACTIRNIFSGVVAIGLGFLTWFTIRSR